MENSKEVEIDLKIKALVKVKNYCALQERSTFEVKNKLKDLGISDSQCKDILNVLEEENYLNDTRFAMAYAGGKFRIKHWGKLKIISGLQSHHIAEKVIQNALQTIDPSEYQKVLNELIRKKLNELKKEDDYIKKQKVIRFVLSRGFEYAMAKDLLRDLD